MNIKVVGHYISKIMIVISIFLLLPIIVALAYGEYKEILPFIYTIAAFLAVGIPMMVVTKGDDDNIGNKDALIIVGLIWIIVSALGALPFVIDGCIPNYVDAFFETVSGFTTTGASILNDIAALPHSMLFWRSFTHWIGGMGILVFILALIPSTDGSTFNLFKFESPGPQVGKLSGKLRHTAGILYLTYFVMTILEILLLVIGGAINGKIDIFNSLIVGMGTAGTGGFAATNASIAQFDSVYVEVVVTVFMFLFGINFNLYYLMILRRYKEAFFDHEFRLYVSYIVMAIALITINLTARSYYSTVGEALRYSSFAVLSLSSSTGFATADFALWPGFSQSLLVMCMFFGACAGSTGGGFKVSRILVLVKVVWVNLLQVLNPHSVQVVKVNGRTMSDEEINSIMKYFSVYCAVFLVGFLLISINGFDFVTNFTTVLTCLSNGGPGFGAIVGPYGGYSGMSIFTKLVMCLLMFIGRLEIFPILLLFVPKTWKRTS